jgi:hypothetical protein
MNKAACIVYIGGFLALPPALLMARWFDKARMPWVLLLAVSVIVGWLLVNLAYMFYFNGLLVQMSATGDLRHGELNAFTKNDFLFSFGWLLGPAYSMPWLFLYCVLVFVRRMLTSRSV